MRSVSVICRTLTKCVRIACVLCVYCAGRQRSLACGPALPHTSPYACLSMCSLLGCRASALARRATHLLQCCSFCLVDIMVQYRIFSSRARELISAGRSSPMEVVFDDAGNLFVPCNVALYELCRVSRSFVILKRNEDRQSSCASPQRVLIALVLRRSRPLEMLTRLSFSGSINKHMALWLVLRVDDDDLFCLSPHARICRSQADDRFVARGSANLAVVHTMRAIENLFSFILLCGDETALESFLPG